MTQLYYSSTTASMLAHSQFGCYTGGNIASVPLGPAPRGAQHLAAKHVICWQSRELTAGFCVRLAAL
jgi:hypothetical protein